MKVGGVYDRMSEHVLTPLLYRIGNGKTRSTPVTRTQVKWEASIAGSLPILPVEYVIRLVASCLVNQGSNFVLEMIRRSARSLHAIKDGIDPFFVRSNDNAFLRAPLRVRLEIILDGAHDKVERSVE